MRGWHLGVYWPFTTCTIYTGYDNGRAITSNDVISLFTAEQQRDSGKADREVSPISFDWDPVWREHVMSYRDRGGDGIHEHLATYPTLAFMQVRLRRLELGTQGPFFL